MASKKKAKKESSPTTTHQPAIVTRTSPRTAIPKLGSDSDPQPPINVASGSGKAKLDSVPKPPKSKKGEPKTSGGGGGESSSSKKKVDTETAAIVTQSSIQQPGKADSVSLPPKSKKTEKTTYEGGGGGGGESSAAIVTQRSTRNRGNGKVGSNVLPDSSSATATPTRISNRRGKETLKSPLAIAENPKLESKLPSASTPSSDSRTISDEGIEAKKRVTMEPGSSSARRDKGKAKLLEPSKKSTWSSADMVNVQNNLAIAKALKDNDFPHMFAPVQLTASDVNAVLAPASPSIERAVVRPTSGVLTRRAKSQLGSVPTPPPANPQPPKSKAKATSSISGSTRPGKPKTGTDPTPPADPQPPKSKAKATASTSGSTRRGKTETGTDPQTPKCKAKATASTSGSTRRGKAKTGSDPTPPADPEPPKPNKAKGGAASTSDRGKTKMGSDPTPPPKRTTRGNSSAPATPKNKRTVEPSSRVLRSGKKN